MFILINDLLHIFEHSESIFAKLFSHCYFLLFFSIARQSGASLSERNEPAFSFQPTVRLRV